MPRFLHKLRGNESTRTPCNVMVFDTETLPHPHPTIKDARLHKLRLWVATTWRDVGGAVTRQRWHQGTSAAEFWRLVYQQAAGGKPLHVFAHNLGFDATVSMIWRELEVGQLTMSQPPNWRGADKPKPGVAAPLGLLVLDDPPTIIETWVKGTRRRVLWLDTMNWWRASLEALAPEFGLEKVPLPEFSAPDAAWIKRCRSDVEITAACVRTIAAAVREHDLGVFKYTISAQAMAAYKHRFMEHEITIHREPEPLELERAAYRGGEVRMGYQGKVTCGTPPLFGEPADQARDHKPTIKGPVHVYDVQAFYPSVMRGNLYPTCYVGQCVTPPMESFLGLMDDYFCSAYVELDTADVAYPARHKGRSVMAVGRFATELCGPELARAARCGHIKRLGRVCWYDQAELFTPFVDYFWKLRCQLADGDKPQQAEVIKTLMVSLFGKFGQRANEWPDRRDVRFKQFYGQWWEHDAKSGRLECFRSIGERVQLHVTEGESAESFPLIAAAVTSYGRCRMAQLRQTCGAAYFLYQDTDSLHVLEPGADALQVAGECREGVMGKLALQGVYQEAEYRGIKDYTLDNRRIIAGVKRQAEEVGHRQFSQTNFQRLGSIIAAPPLDGVTVREQVIQLDEPELVGRVDSWGRVSPVVLGVDAPPKRRRRSRD